MTNLTKKEMKTIVLEELNAYLSEVAPGDEVEPEGAPQAAPQAEPEADTGSGGGISTQDLKTSMVGVLKTYVPKMTPKEKEWFNNMMNMLARLAAEKNALAGPWVADMERLTKKIAGSK